MKINTRKQEPLLRVGKPVSAKGLVHGFVLPFAVIILIVLIWYLVCRFRIFPAYALAPPGDVSRSFKEEISAGRLLNDIVASPWRVAIGFVAAALRCYSYKLMDGSTFGRQAGLHTGT